MKDTVVKSCSILFDVLLQKGVRNVVCSPGSRNVPLLLAAASRQGIKKHFAVDERAAAFLGLGISLVKQEPVALICTSGTAMLNYAPAVAEAYYQGLPLIIISADRPIQWIDQDDSQTIRQDGALENYVKKSYSIPVIDNKDSELLWYINRITNDAVMQAFGNRPGPVHINVHLGEPLGGKTDRNPTFPRIINTMTGDSIANKEILKDLALKLASSKIFLIAGFQPPEAGLQKAIATFSRLPNVVVMAETISNLHLNQEDFSIDSVLTAYEESYLDNFCPDIIISIGGALVSRKLKEFLRRNRHKSQHWAIGYSHTTSDPFMSLNLKIEAEPIRFFRNLNSYLKRPKIAEEVKDFQKTWLNLRRNASLIKNLFIERCDWSELKAFDSILKKIPGNYNLFLSNGTPVRYAQIISYPLPHASYCNRGVSGIDGSVSTAIGGALAYNGNSLLITGDLSLAYDIGALSLKNIPNRFKIIVIDNQGGGIFRFIPATSNLEECEEYLCQTPLLPLKQLAEGYDWDFFECDDENLLNKMLPAFLSSQKKAILKVSCDGIKSASILKDYMNLKVEK